MECREGVTDVLIKILRGRLERYSAESIMNWMLVQEIYYLFSYVLGPGKRHRHLESGLIP